MTDKKTITVVTGKSLYFSNLREATGIIVHIQFAHIHELNCDLVGTVFENNPELFETKKEEFDTTGCISEKDKEVLLALSEGYLDEQMLHLIETIEQHKVRHFRQGKSPEISVVFDTIDKNIIDGFISAIKSAYTKVMPAQEEYERTEYNTHTEDSSYSLMFQTFIFNPGDAKEHRNKVIKTFHNASHAAKMGYILNECEEITPPKKINVNDNDVSAYYEKMEETSRKYGIKPDTKGQRNNDIIQTGRKGSGSIIACFFEDEGYLKTGSEIIKGIAESNSGRYYKDDYDTYIYIVFDTVNESEIDSIAQQIKSKTNNSVRVNKLIIKTQMRITDIFEKVENQ